MQVEPLSGGIGVPIRRLDDIVAELDIRRCDVVKADIEGGELDFLRGGEQFLREHKPVIYLEFNDFQMKRRGWSTDDLLALAAGWDYVAHVRKGKHHARFTHLPPGSIQNVFLIHQTQMAWPAPKRPRLDPGSSREMSTPRPRDNLQRLH